MNMKRALVTVAGLLVVAVAFIGGAAWGVMRGKFQHALEENKIAVANLRHGGTNVSPQLREYLKTRIYSNIEVCYPSRSGYLMRDDWDFGPVNQSILGDIATYKEWSTFDWDAAIKHK